MAEVSFTPVIAQIVAQCAARPARLALVESGRSLSYAELGQRVDRVAAALQRDGVRPGDSVALCATSTLHYVVAMLGVLRCGAVAVPLPNSATAQVLAGLLADCGAGLVFVDAAMAAVFAPLQPPLPIPQVTLDDSPRGLPLSTWLAPPGSVPQPVSCPSGAPFNIIYSSGTTGAPKGIVHPQGLRTAQVARSAGLGYGADSVKLLATPLYSNITLTGLYPTLALGGTVVLMPKFDAAEYLQLAAFVVLREGAARNAQALMTWVNGRVGKTQRIAAVEFVDSLPRGPVGKVLKRELRERYRNKYQSATCCGGGT